MKKINPFTEFREQYITELQFCENYLIWNHPQNLEALKINLNNIIHCTVKQDIKLGLEIIFILLSHTNQEIKALSLEHLFFLFHTKEIKTIIIKELKCLSKVEEAAVSNAANYSLDNISHHISPFEIIEYFNRLFSNIEYRIQNISHLQYISLRKRMKTTENELKKHPHFRDIYFEIDSLFYQLLNFSYNLESKILNESSTEFKWEDYETGLLHIYDLKKLEYNPLSPLKKLSKMYAATFTEEGHLRRLKGYLNDEDPDIRLMGIMTLSEIAYTLLENSNSQKILNPHLTLDQYEKIKVSSNIGTNSVLENPILE